jgi:hypothetical protein
MSVSRLQKAPSHPKPHALAGPERATNTAGFMEGAHGLPRTDPMVKAATAGLKGLTASNVNATVLGTATQLARQYKLSGADDPQLPTLVRALASALYDNATVRGLVAPGKPSSDEAFTAAFKLAFSAMGQVPNPQGWAPSA